MCGICGEIVFSEGVADAAAIGRMMGVMSRRGPDAAGQILRSQVGLGHRRLKIIDLTEKAAQPMIDSELGLEIAFNGCIYNYPQLRQELQGKGYRFFSTGDTEVILKAYHAWGPSCVERFNGMFAFAIHERDTGRVVLARDRFGIKPLYLSETPGRLRFASSLPAILAAGDVDTTIDKTALAFYMSFHAVVPPPYTILKGVRKLAPATVRVIEPSGDYTDRTFWQLDFARDAADVDRSFDDWRDMVLEALRRAVARRMVADVPVGVLLSGGVDSSVIVGLLAEAGQHGLMTFSVGFEEAHGEKGDEFQYSDLIAKRFETNHHKIFVPSERLMDALPGTIGAMSEPMVSYDNVGFYLLSQEVSKHIKVVQSGQGADEVFAGYHWYPPLMSSNDVASDYARVFFDRSFDTLKAHLAPQWHTERDEALAYVSDHFATRRRGLARRQGAAAGLHRHAGRRSGEARRQYDHGLEPGGARAVPRSRAGRTGRAHPARAQAGPRRQGRAEGGGPPGGAVGGHRPQEGLFPRTRAQISRRSLSGRWSRTPSVPTRRVSGACSGRTISTLCSPIRKRISRPCAAPSSGKWRCWRCGCRRMAFEIAAAG